MIESLQIIKRCWQEGSFDFAGDHYQITDYDGLPCRTRPAARP